MVGPGRLPDIPGSRNLYDIGMGLTYRPRWYETLGAQTRAYAFHDPLPADINDRQVENELYICPAVPEWTNCRNFAYGYNFQFLGNERLKDREMTSSIIQFQCRASKPPTRCWLRIRWEARQGIRGSGDINIIWTAALI